MVIVTDSLNMAEQQGRGRGRGKKMKAMAYPVFGVICEAIVVASSMSAVGKLRHKYQIKPPSCEPHDDMNTEEKALWFVCDSPKFHPDC